MVSADDYISLFGSDAWMFAAVNNSILRLPGSVPSGASWDNSNKELHLYVNESLAAHTTYTVSFNVTNPAQPQTAPALTVTGTGIPVTTASISSSDALTVAQFSFDIKEMSQSSPFPCDDNTITVTLTSTMPLLYSCAPQITLSNLIDTATVDVSDMTITFLSADMATLSYTGGSWTQSTGTLHINISDAMMQAGTDRVRDISFTFDLMNPERGQAGPAIALDGEIENHNAYSWTQLMNQDATTANLDYTGKADGTIVAPAAGDAATLYIIAASFAVRAISTSTPYPCDMNTITLDL
eukprot:730705-Rhodomonas_salina.1